MKNFDIFYDFLDDLKKSHNNVLLIEAIQQGYQVCFEAVNINKDYLIKLSGNPENLKNVKDKVNSMWTDSKMPSIIKSPDKILPLLYMFEIKKPEIVNKYVLKVIHDLASVNKLTILDKLNSDTTPEQFNNFMTQSRRMLDNLGDLTEEEEKTWLRVKVFHDFEDGFKWIVAIDEEGNVSGYMPSCISFKMASHCGNDQKAREEGDQYFELRKDNKPYLTVIIDANDEIAESKSYNNQKNVNTEKVLPYLKWLLSHEKVKGVGYRYDFGYSADMNMGLKDFFGNDDEFIEQMEKEKPKLIGKTEKIILEYKRKLKLGKDDKPGGITEQDVIERFLNSNINNIDEEDNTDIYLWTLRGILGRIPFNENQLIELIKNKRLTATEIANTSNKLLTDNIQKELLNSDEDAPRVLIEVYNQVEHNNINVGYIIEKYPHQIDSVSKDKRMDTVNKFQYAFIDEFPENQRMDIFNKFPDEFKRILKEKPYYILRFPEGQQRMDIFNEIPDAFAEGFKINPDNTFDYFPKDQRMNIFYKIPDAFAELFKENIYYIRLFPEDQRMNIFYEIPDAFAEIFKKQPFYINDFPEDQRMNIFNKIPDAFAEIFKKRPTLITYFPEDQRMNVLTKFTETKFPDVFAAFAEIFKKHPAFIDVFSPKNQMEIKNMFPDAFN